MCRICEMEAEIGRLRRDRDFWRDAYERLLFARDEDRSADDLA